MKKTYIAPQIKAHKVNITKILSGSDGPNATTIQVCTDFNKKTSTMLSKGIVDIDDEDDEY